MHGLLPILVALAVVASLVFAAASPSSDPSRLVAVTESSQDDGSREAIDASLDGTADDVPRLAHLLRRGSPDQRAAAMTALGYLGGDRAIAALAGYAEQTGDRAATALLYFAMGARGTAADRRALVDALHRDRSGISRFAAALALGVLRADDARPQLAAMAHADPHAYAADAAATALTWLDRGFWQADVPPPAAADDEVIATIVRHGIPGMTADTTYVDVERAGVWVHEDGRWHVRPGVPEGAGRFDPFGPGPALDFAVRRSTDDARALTTVSVWYGPQVSAGWDYVLAKREEGWQVRGVMLAWVS